MKQSLMRKYARLIAVEGAGVQKGQAVVITAELDQPKFVELLVEECYRAGADTVLVTWQHQPLTKSHVRYRSGKTLARVESFELAKWEWMLDTLPCRIFLESEDPDGLKGIRQEKLMKAQQARLKTVKPYHDKMENKYQWCIAAVPGEKWAKKVFPGERKSVAVEKLWQAILSTVRVTEDNDPIAAWAEHNRDLHARCDYLNALNIENLHYTAANGTDFTVGLIEHSRFCGGDETTLSGRRFNANMPTEECFISPMRGKAEGVVYASKPLCYQGQLIENFSFRFHEGKVVELHAEKNEELLRQLVNMDEGSAYLGECALVPYDSPIRESGLLFYNTLFDENAACHLALGVGFPESICGHENYTLEEIHRMGVNDSVIHEDFMIGTEDLSITAECRGGKSVQIFKNGNWAF